MEKQLLCPQRGQTSRPQAITIVNTYYVPGSLLLPCRPYRCRSLDPGKLGMTLPYTDEDKRLREHKWLNQEHMVACEPRFV